ncbi:MAG: TolC family protein [Treponema sp.]|jgi:outer membrane protein TolC|nr:TolC family protein [Treponema sp.]
MFSHRVLWGVLGMLFIFPAAGSAADSNALVLTLDDAVARAVEYSINLQKNRLTLEDREYSSKRLWAEIFPAISASADMSYRNTPFFTGTDVDREFTEQKLNYSTSAGISLSLTAGIPYRMKLLTLAYQQQLLSYEEARRLLEIATAQSFYTLIADKENLTQLVETQALAERQLEKNRISRANGFISEVVVLQSQLAVETAKYNLSTAQADYANQLGVFLTSLGLERQTQVALTGEFSIRQIEEDPERLIREYLPTRPDIQQQRQTIEQLGLTEKRTVMDARSPSLRFSFNWGSGATQSFDKPFADTVSGTAALSIPINPWIPGTKEAQPLRSAKSDIERALLDLKNTEDTAAAQIRSLTAGLRNSWESLEIARLREQIAQRSYELTERGFLAGAVESLTLEDSLNSLASARYQLLRSELNYQNMVLDLARAINVDWRQFLRSVP